MTERFLSTQYLINLILDEARLYDNLRLFSAIYDFQVIWSFLTLIIWDSIQHLI